jgi:23S rRNA (guanosine2251-2'-O)-methyltransferase
LPADQRLVLGLQAVRECVRARGREILELLVAADGGPQIAALERFARDQGVASVQRVERGRLDQLARGIQHQGAIAIAPELKLHELGELLADPQLIAVALDRIQDPQNFGAVVRSAVGIGGAAVIWGEHASAPLTPSTFRAAAGAIEHARLCRVPSLVGAIQQAKEAGVSVIALAAEAPTLLASLDLRQPSIVVIGSEGQGLQAAVRRACDHQAALVRPGFIDSLNASVAAAIALYEVAKSRGLS